MEYREFIEQVRRSVEDRAGEAVRVSVNRILKNNVEPVDGLTILHEGDNVARAIWLNPLYRRYEYGESVNAIAEEILEYNERHREIGHCDISFYTDFEKVKGRIACKIIHTDMNRALIREVPHRAFLDMTVVYYYKVENSVFGNASILIKNEHMNLWKTSQEELDRFAMKNTLRLLPYEFMDIMELIRQIEKDDMDECFYHDIPMYVLTNTEKNFGAACILFPTVLRDMGERLGDNYYVLPSSIHECIIIPEECGILPNELHSMTEEINSEHVAAEELLGDSVYLYDRETGVLSIVCQKEKP